MERMERSFGFSSRRTVLVAAALAVFLTGLLNSQTKGDQPSSKFVTVGSLPSGWQMALLKHGDRLQKAGKERMILSGTVTRQGAAAAAFQVTRELPNLVRYQEQGGPNATVLVFDGTQYAKGNGPPQKPDTDLMETLAYDSPDWFFYLTSSGAPVRKLGARFRMEDPNRKGSSLGVYDVYAVLERVQQPGKVKQQLKYVHVNSDTHAVERIRYTDADNPSTKVEIVLGDWTEVSGNRVPGSIRRLENGVEVLKLTHKLVTLGSAVADNAFRNAAN